MPKHVNVPERGISVRLRARKPRDLRRWHAIRFSSSLSRPRRLHPVSADGGDEIWERTASDKSGEKIRFGKKSMGKGYSILICPWGGANVRRVALSRRALRGLEIVAVLLLCAKAYFFSDYLSLRLEREVVDQIKAEKEQNKERLARLYDQAEEMQRLLSRWKALKANVRASVPSRRGSSGEERAAVEQLEERLASLHGELESLVASIPTAWPVDGWVSSGVGLRVSPWTGKRQFHSGLDIPEPIGTPVHAPADGRVRLVGNNAASGRVLVLDHGDGIATHYAHLSKIHVPKDALVEKGQWIADVGSTGRSTGPHLHYEVRVDGVAIDPRRHLLKSSS